LWAVAKKRIEQQHAKGKLTARERVEYCWMKLIEELGKFVMHAAKILAFDKEHYLGDGVNHRYGTIQDD